MIREVPPFGGTGQLVCPVCGEPGDIACRKCEKRRAPENSPIAKLAEIRNKKGLDPAGPIVSSAMIGYDIRFIPAKLGKDFDTDLALYFQSIQELTKPDLMIFTGDQRQGRDRIQLAFKQFAQASGIESFAIDGTLSATVAPFLSACLSWSEKKTVLGFHSTASHDPIEYNGIKTFSGRCKHDFFPAKLNPAELDASLVMDSYIDWISQELTGRIELSEKVSFDFMNGAGGPVFKRFLTKHAANFELRNELPLTGFGGKQPVPPAEQTFKTAWGFCADGDFDRGPLYLNNIRIDFSDFLARLAVLGWFKPKKLLTDQRVSPIMIDFLKAQGIDAIIGSVGRTYQENLAEKAKCMWIEENWHTGGLELKGQRFFWMETPLAIVSWLSILSDKPLTQLIDAPVPKIYRLIKTLDVGFGFNEKIAELAGKRFGNVQEIMPDCGTRIEMASGHIVIRQSNTELGKARVNVSGVSKQEAAHNLKTGLELAKLAGARPV
ncbi:MAG: hypothetical protein GOU99_02165 [Candidatus Altiarchaeota archaeon]|nr:hypothetical protein [Candidatus Altiarchaeota archaeon]